MPERAERCGEAEPAGVLDGLGALEALSEQPEGEAGDGLGADELIAVYAGAAVAAGELLERVEVEEDAAHLLSERLGAGAVLL